MLLTCSIAQHAPLVAQLTAHDATSQVLLQQCHNSSIARPGLSLPLKGWDHGRVDARSSTEAGWQMPPCVPAGSAALHLASKPQLSFGSVSNPPRLPALWEPHCQLWARTARTGQLDRQAAGWRAINPLFRRRAVSKSAVDSTNCTQTTCTQPRPFPPSQPPSAVNTAMWPSRLVPLLLLALAR